jgi:heptosyltransferase III
MARVLVIRGGAVGDFIVTLPAIRCLKESIPDCHLEVLGYASIAQLAVAAGYADAVRSLEHRGMAMLFVPNAQLAPELEQWLKSFTLVVSYLYDPDGLVRGNMQRLGIRTYLEMPHRVADGAGYAAEQLAAPLAKIALFPEELRPRILLPDAETKQPGRVALHPGSGGERKNWPTEHWITLGKELLQQAAVKSLVLLTGEAEQERGSTAEIRAAWQGLPHEHWDSLALTELARRLSSCTHFLGHDSGTAHLAAACGVQTLQLFGPSSAETWAPRGSLYLQAEEGDLRALPYATVRDWVLQQLCRR